MRQRLIIAGGGLAGVLAALAFTRRPDVETILVEAGHSLGGTHTWSFFATDVDAPAAELIEPLVVHRWEGYDVRFRNLARTLSTPYRTVNSARLDAVGREKLGSAVRLNVAVEKVTADSVLLAGGERIVGDAVIDARGPREMAGVTLAYQKFLGREVRLAAPHGLSRPTIMDATVDQLDGFRFVYLLPFSHDTLLIEDTYYAQTGELEFSQLRARIEAYAAGRGWTITEDIAEETGALPLVLSSDVDLFWRAASSGGAVPLGLRAGLFHLVTGYSLPLAARTAVTLAGVRDVATAALSGVVERIVRQHFAAAAFDRLLNRLLFLAGQPQNRHRVLERFHRMPQRLIERFYAGRMERADVARVLIGKPPVPVLDALRVLHERAPLK